MEHMDEKELLQTIASQILEFPDQIVVEKTENENETKLVLKVAKEDMGKAIGSEGRTAKALRAIMHAYGGRHNKRIMLFVGDENERRDNRS